MTADQAAAEPSKPRICWHAETFDPKMASVRLRVFQPMRALRELGYDVRELRGRQTNCDAIVFSKSDSPGALSIASAAACQHRRIIYDICDNIFEKPPTNELDKQRKERAKSIMRYASVVTCSTQPLARLIAQAVPEIAEKIEIIPDALEQADPSSRAPSLRERVALWRLRSFLRRHPRALHLVWFGKCKKGYAGIEHLQPLVDLIERISLDRPVTLTVISNRRRLYYSNSSGWRIPKFYLPWSLATFDTALRLHEVAVIPVEENAYTIGKTINRPATALMAGLGVIADPIPAYEELRPFVFLGDWEGGLRHYDECPPAMDERISAAQAHLRQCYGSDVITDRWVEVIEARDR